MSSILRHASKAVHSASRTFSSSAVARRDLVQELYIKELKAYKAPPRAKDAHLSAVKAYALPPTPQVPALPTDLASELAAYDAAEPTTAEQAKPVAAKETAQAGTGADAFLSFLEADEPKAEAHH